MSISAEAQAILDQIRAANNALPPFLQFMHPSQKLCVTYDARVNDLPATGPTHQVAPTTEAEDREFRIEDEPVDLPTYKRGVLRLVDAECRRRFAMGYTYSGKQFSLNLPAQINHNGARHSKAHWTATGRFPVRVSTLDNQDSIELANETEFDAMFEVAADSSRDIHQDCQTVKRAVRQATDVAGVDAAASSYLAGGAP